MKKWVNDFIIGLVVLVLTLGSLVYSTMLENSRMVTVFLARPDIYMALVLSVLAILALLLVVRAWKQRKTPEGQEKCLPIWTLLPTVTVATLFIYILVLDKLGFVLDSIVMLWVLIFLYSINSGETEKDQNHKITVIKKAIKSGLFAVVCSFAIYFIFTGLLSAKLPGSRLF